MNIYISGSMAYDRIMDFPGRFSDHILPDKIHILNVCFTVNGLVEKFGGTAGNIAYSLSLLKEKSIIIASIGKDYEPYFKWLHQNAIATDGIRIVEEEFTAGAYITTDKADNQITGFNPGAMKYQSAFDFNKVDPSNSIVIISAGNLNDMKDIAEECKNRGIPYICDPGQSLTLWDKDGLMKWINGSFMLITNDYEIEMIMNLTGLDKKSLLQMTKTIITTLGEKGSLISTADYESAVSAVNAENIVDPTGAGDAFRAGLLKGITAGNDIVSAAKIGAVAAVYAVEKYGTQEHSYSPEEFAFRYRNAFGEDIPICF